MVSVPSRLTHSVVHAGDDAMRFAHDLARDNMAQFYAIHGRAWDTSIFVASWPRTENFLLLEGDVRVGTLRLSREADALCVRDVQVLSAHQGRGAGTYALAFADNLATERGITKVRLSVFSDNRAQSLYRRLGFGKVACQGGLLVFEKSRPIVGGEITDMGCA
jgi:ribosomal protein S18 acetylase RimI-like enzyme